MNSFVSTAFEESIPDASLLALFSSDKSRQEAVSRTIYSIGRNDPERARRLLDEHISLPGVRSQVEEWLDRQQQLGGVTVYRGGVIINN